MFIISKPCHCFLMPVWHSGGMEIDLTLISCAFCLIPAMSCQWPAITTYPSKNWTIFCPNKCLRSELIQFHCHTTRQNNVTLISFSLLRWSPASVFLSWSSRLSTSIYRAKGHQHFSGLCMTFFKQEILQIFVVFLHTFGHEHFVSCKANKEKWQILKNIAWEKLHWADTWYLGVERERGLLRSAATDTRGDRGLGERGWWDCTLGRA